MIYRGSGKKRKRKQGNKNKNSRLNILITIIFLFGFALMARLAYLQLFKSDLYIALANDQHLVNNEIEAMRGRIFIQDKSENTEVDLYPIATNKDFAFLYAIPKKIKNPDYVANELYKIFDETRVVEELDEELKADEYFKALFPEEWEDDGESEEVALNVQEYEELKEFYEIKKEAELKIRKIEAVESYMARLNKPDDPYEPIKKKVEDEDLEKVLAIDTEGLDYMYEKHRYYPEKNYGSQLIGFVGYQGDEEAGRYGLEGFFDEELSGRRGFIKAERAANGDLIIINDREYEEARDGSSLILTIDRSIQYVACKRLEEEAMRYGADGGTVIVMEPNTGAILAMCSWPDYDPNHYNEVDDTNVYNNPAIFDAYEPGSIFKTITLAAAIDDGVIEPETTYFDKGYDMVEGWDKPIKNSDYETHGGHGNVDMKTVLEESLNTGTIFAVEELGYEKFSKYVRKFGFGEKTGIELETEGVSNIENLLRTTMRPVEIATASFGQGITATPLQIISAYSVIANGGMLIKPHLVAEIVNPDGTIFKTQPAQLGRVVSERTALLVSGMLVNVVDGGHATLAAVDGYYVAGKTGTAQVAGVGGYSNKTIHSFVGFAPVDDPKFVMLVKLDDPKSVEYSASSAAPLFGELAEFILNYYQVDKER
ncbi:hypothetical protein C0583_02545 [Candidatus Parcubacteria bacterium]|nr:MAG: hypothetical protein C0583_02545 [Candidatus Parcubacteria bacterium]